MNQLVEPFPVSLSAFFPSSTASESARPFYSDDSASDRARKFKQMLLDLSKNETDKKLKSVLRSTADFFRESFFGLTEKQIHSRVVRLLEDYFDGETYTALEIENIAEVTGIKVEVLLPVLEEMVKSGALLQGRRRRWNELGEHYNFLYKLPEKN